MKNAFIIIKVKEDGTDAKPFLADAEDILRLLDLAKPLHQSVFKIEKLNCTIQELLDLSNS